MVVVVVGVGRSGVVVVLCTAYCVWCVFLETLLLMDADKTCLTAITPPPSNSVLAWLYIRSSTVDLTYSHDLPHCLQLDISHG